MAVQPLRMHAYRLRKHMEEHILHPIRVAVHTLVASLFLRRRLLHVATGADSSHFHSMLQMINTLKVMEQSGFRVVAYDLGLTAEERSRFAEVHPDVELVRFPFEDYPPHFDMSKGAGEYAWKPCIVHEVYAGLARGEYMLWLDAGTFVRRKMWIVRSALRFRGFYTRLTTGTVREWTHPETVRRLDMASVQDYRMITGGLIGFRKDERNDRLVGQWRDGALDKGIIAPEGSSRANHRQDQSVVTLLYYRNYPFRRSPPPLSRLEHELLIHYDIG